MATKTGQPGRKNEDTAAIERNLQKFRPIAPKPVAPGSVSASSALLNQKRTKRRYVKKNSKSNAIEEGSRKDVLFPVAVDPLQSPAGGSSEKGVSLLNSIYPNHTNRVVETWLLVDRLSETFSGHGMYIGGLFAVDDGACPELVSDGEQRVERTNLAYKKMVGDEMGRPPLEISVWIVMKEDIPENWTLFSCRGRFMYRCGEDKPSKHIIMHCEVKRRMDLGGFVWRLDANSALRLGPSPQSQ